MKSLFVLIVLALNILVFSGFSAMAATGKKKESIQEIARDAYVWGYPAVAMAHARETMLGKTRDLKNSTNHFFHSPTIPDPLLGNFIALNPENIYSWAWIDLSKEPLVLIHPEIKDRFYSLQFIDAYSNVFATISNRTQSEKAGIFLICPPGWQGSLPEKMLPIHSSTSEIFVLAQIFVKDSKEISNIAKLEAQYQLIPLSVWRNGNGIEGDSFKSEYPKRTLKVDRNLAASGLKFYQELLQIMKKNPPSAQAEMKEMERFKSIGLNNKGDFDKFSSGSEAKILLERGLFEGERDIQGRLASDGNAKVNGWIFELKSPPFTEDYLLRAATSQRYLFSPPAQESMRMVLDSDSEARQLNSLYLYVLHFDKEDFPAARKMWSLQIQETKNIKSRNGRPGISVINDKSDKLKYNEDGSLDLYFQSEKPKLAQRSNWLPLPKDANFQVILTLFNPHNSALNHKYIAPSLIRQEENRPPKQRFTQTMIAVSK